MTYYKSLDYLPYKLLLHILATNEYYLLSKSERELSEFKAEELEKLEQVWNRLYKDYLSVDPNKEAGKTLNIEKEIAHFTAKYKLIVMYCHILRFDFDQEAFDNLRDYGYRILDGPTYYQDLERIEREAEGLLVKAEKYQSQLPKQEEGDHSKPAPVDEVLASYSAILGIDFDYNTVSVKKVVALSKQVDAKIKMLQKQSPKK